MNNTIQIFDPIGTGTGEYSHKQFVSELKALGDVPDLVVEIHSEGGSIFEGFAIHDTLKQHSATVTTKVYGGAFSIASVIALAGDIREIAENGFFMIHKGMTVADGTSVEIRSSADRLDKFNQRMVSVYSSAMGVDESQVAAMLDAETWFDADEAIAAGLATKKIEPVLMAAKFDRSKFKNCPESVGKNFKTQLPDVPAKDETLTGVDEMAKAEPQPASIKQLKAAFPKATTDFYVAMMEDEKTIEEAQGDYATAMEEEQIAMEEELKALRAENEDLKAKAMEEEEPEAMEEEEPVARSKANRAVAGVRTRSKQLSARAQWDSEVDRFVGQGLPRYKAVQKTAVKFPKLREQLVEEANN